MRPFLVLLLLLAAAPVLAVTPARAEDASFALVLKDHKFTPDRIEVAAGTKFRLTVSNQDSTVEEFDSDDLKRERVITGGRQATMVLGPLDPGTYKFMGEYHSDTAQGVIVAK